MNSSLCVALDPAPEHAERLRALQTAFAHVCNALAPLVQEQRCWNRVTLHHLAYKSLREKFPALGSQMICNAIYSVSRTSRLIFQHPDSPFHHTKLEGKSLPLLRFGDNSPVYFDRHTLSLKAGVLSLYTLDGRMRCAVTLPKEAEVNFHEKKVREIALSRRADGTFQLMFHFVDPSDEQEPAVRISRVATAPAFLPTYVQLEVPA
jgi:hypothetical protein